jgi:hypothetical protein
MRHRLDPVEYEVTMGVEAALQVTTELRRRDAARFAQAFRPLDD